MGDPGVRKVLVQRCVERALSFMSVTAPTARRLDEVETGAGAIFCDFSMITSNVVIGRHFHANIYSYVAHDCVIGDYVTLAPGAKVNGNVHVKDLAYVGTGAIIKQGRPDEPVVIGEGAVVGMGAVVTKSVPPGAVVVEPRPPIGTSTGMSRRTRARTPLWQRATACGALVLASPVVAGGAAMVVATIGRPAFFRQTRAGVGGQPFTLIKLRTMRHDPSGAQPDEDRLTKVGLPAPFDQPGRTAAAGERRARGDGPGGPPAASVEVCRSLHGRPAAPTSSFHQGSPGWPRSAVVTPCRGRRSSPWTWSMSRS